MSILQDTPARLRRLAPLQEKPSGSLLVHEIYRSLQGESTFAGLPCIFVRLTACHLRCRYCDTAHAFAGGDILSIDNVVSRVLDLGDGLVELTGGEPLLQPESLPLMERLSEAGRTVLLETSGSIDVSGVDPRVRIILDMKTPGSGEVLANDYANLDRIGPLGEIKFVVADRADFDWCVRLVGDRGLAARNPILVAPVHGKVEPVELAAWILESRLPMRLQLQLHKAIWGASTRGV